MDPRERFNDPQTATRAALAGWQAGIWTALPGYLTKIDLALQTVSVQPTLQGVRQQPDGQYVSMRMPLLVDCPIVFPGGGGFTLTFPLAVGDECLVVFASRCIDAWWQSGGIQPQAEVRLHDLSDGFVIVGPRSRPRALGGVSGATVQLRSDDGSTYVEVDDAGNVNVVAPTKVTLTTPELHVTGKITVGGEVVAVGEGTFNGGHTVSQHKHGGVQTGGGQTATPTG